MVKLKKYLLKNFEPEKDCAIHAFKKILETNPNDNVFSWMVCRSQGVIRVRTCTSCKNYQGNIYDKKHRGYKYKEKKK